MQYNFATPVLGVASKKSYICSMFVRKKNNRSGSTSVVVVDKRGGKIHCLKTIGVSSDETEIAEFYRRGKKWVSDHSSGKDLFEESARKQEEKQTTERFLSKVENVLLNDTQLVLNRLWVTCKQSNLVKDNVTNLETQVNRLPVR
jgi:hypothetical protein